MNSTASTTAGGCIRCIIARGEAVRVIRATTLRGAPDRRRTAEASCADPPDRVDPGAHGLGDRIGRDRAECRGLRRFPAPRHRLPVPGRARRRRHRGRRLRHARRSTRRARHTRCRATRWRSSSTTSRPPARRVIVFDVIYRNPTPNDEVARRTRRCATPINRAGNVILAREPTIGPGRRTACTPPPS